MVVPLSLLKTPSVRTRLRNQMKRLRRGFAEFFDRAAQIRGRHALDPAVFG